LNFLFFDSNVSLYILHYIIIGRCEMERIPESEAIAEPVDARRFSEVMSWM
jgi:hypothetical protein